MFDKGSIRMTKRCTLLFLLILTLTSWAQEWNAPVRGSWIADTGLTLVGKDRVADIVVSPDAHSCVKQAAKFLASDIEKITGQKPDIVPKVRNNKPFIRLATAGSDRVPADFRSLSGKWEAHKIQTVENGVWLVGSNPRGTAFAVYTFSERIGIDPLYCWTGYTPEKHEILRVKPIDYTAGEPTFKYRGLFHDDEDTLPQELDERGLPQAGGTIDPAWYKRYFETALRLRMNQVAPYTRAKRTMEVQQMASDWGLFYTSHHYDILLSNPWGYSREGLAEKRGVDGRYDWAENREGITKYWKAGVEENKDLDCIWPVGLRGTHDGHYEFPEGTTQEEKNRVFTKAMTEQVEMTKAILSETKNPVFHFTLYAEMLKAFQAGTLNLPEDVILVWNDDGDGIMRALPEPEELGKWKHGIYYHLAYYGHTTKQTAHTITPMRIEEQFRNIVKAGATEYMLCNVSEMREHTMNTRFIAGICWDAETAFSREDAADRFSRWWSREYFGNGADGAYSAYMDYFRIYHAHDQIWQGARSLERALHDVYSRLAGDHHAGRWNDPEKQAEYNRMKTRASVYEKTLASAREAQSKMNAQEARFFYEHVIFPLLIDYRPTKAAEYVWQSTWSWPQDRIFALINQAEEQLQLLEDEVDQAERPPFQDWYKDTWIRRYDSYTNVHYSNYRMQDFRERYKQRNESYKHRYSK
ncbi:hypothetical protein EGM51_06225 [Verrucomicrobia bacterium S94]|nr:hypothetical protein EGM51_06225 [Verrucomicrobia bacterium S94]